MRLTAIHAQKRRCQQSHPLNGPWPLEAREAAINAAFSEHTVQTGLPKVAPVTDKFSMENGDSTVRERERADTEQIPHWPVRAALASPGWDQDYLCNVH